MIAVHHEFYGAAAAAVLGLHVGWLLFVIVGAWLTPRRPALAAIHVCALAWGIAVEAGPWACPLTALEQRLQQAAGTQANTQSFLAHYLDRLVYPDIPGQVLVAGAVAVCACNLAVYGFRWAALIRARAASTARQSAS